jgi:hypothetical protein
MKRRAIHYILAASFAVITGLFVSTDQRDTGVVILPPAIAISETIAPCGMPIDLRGYLGWPFASFGSLDDQSCEGNSAMIYEIMYPSGILANASVGLIVYFGINKTINYVRKRSQ